MILLSLPSWSGGGSQQYDLKAEGDNIELEVWDGFENATLTLTKAEARAMAGWLLLQCPEQPASDEKPE